MNTIPAGAVPKLFRQRNKEKKEVGSYYVNVNKKPVNLGTQDYMKARERARAAYYDGVTTFPNDRYEILPQLPPMPSNGTNGAATTQDWTADVVSAASDGLKPEVFPPEDSPRPDIPPVSEDHSASEAKADAPKSDGPKVSISPDMVKGIIKQAAQIAVELQIRLQEWLWARAAHVRVKEIPPDHQSRELATQLWEQAIAEWIPPELPIPAWLMAPIMCAACTVPVQMENMEAIPRPPKKTE